MAEPKSNQGTAGSKFTAVRMERRLYVKAKRKARSRHQTYSEYVRQLIVRDIAEEAETVASDLDNRGPP